MTRYGSKLSPDQSNGNSIAVEAFGIDKTSSLSSKLSEAAWAGGDDAAIWSMGGASMKSQFPAVYAALISARNQKWADLIVKELEGKGTDFIAVGTLHLTGPDSVQSVLKARGYKVERN